MVRDSQIRRDDEKGVFLITSSTSRSKNRRPSGKQISHCKKKVQMMMKAFQCKEPKEPSLRTIWERKYNIKCCMKVKMELNTWSSNTHIVSFKPSFDHLTSYYNLDERPSGSEREWSEIHRYEAMIKKRCFWLPPLQCRPKKWRPSGTQISSCKKKKKRKKKKKANW